MSKYIIDIPDGVEWGVVTCRTEDGFYTRDFDSLEVLNSDYINEHFGDLQDDAYKRGINDGSLDVKQRVEGAYQKGFEDGKAQREHDDKIEVGDEVNWLGDCFIVTRIFQPRNMKEQCDGIDDDGCVYRDILMDDLEKTGRHFGIASILEDMRND